MPEKPLRPAPIPPHGRLRTYFHHVIRLSYVLPDLGMIAQPCLNIVDGLTGQARMEWNGEGRIADCLVAGDHVIATDACGSHLMGTDPALDWPHLPSAATAVRSPWRPNTASARRT